MAKSSNWHAFLDPNEEWEQTIYRNNAAVVRQVDLVPAERQAGAGLRRLEHVLAEVPRTQPRGVDARRERPGAARVHLHPAVGPTNMINTAVAVNAAHKMRFAQDLALFNLDLSEDDRGIRRREHTGRSGRSAPEWQPTREVVERLTAVGDWCELLFATNIVFEQLVGRCSAASW